MHTRHMPVLLRTHRRSWGLTQKEMAALLGFASSAHVSRIEQGKRTPSTETALACTVLFSVSLDELFPQLTTAIEKRLYERATRLHQGLLHTTTSSGVRKRDLLMRALRLSDGETSFTSV
ncbi:MAG: helix-turn-helix transcriptional regulator [Leptothrix sp. (in: b-proteobacteria)]